MLKIRYVLVVLGMLLCSLAPATAEVSVSIGINLPAYPRLVVVPGYPVYYAPRLEANYFFYDGMYWVYQNDNWYASSWYNGPWWLVYPEAVPVFILRIPVRYYRQPPAYFYGWRPDAAPRWGDHWGYDWEQRRRGWNSWNRNAAPPPAPPPVYQRQYSGDRYPRHVEQQQQLHRQKYRYQSRDPVVRRHYRAQVEQRAFDRQERQGTPRERGYMQQDNQRSMPRQLDGPDSPRSQSLQLMPGAQGWEETQQGRNAAREAVRLQEQEQELEREREQSREQGWYRNE